MFFGGDPFEHFGGGGGPRGGPRGEVDNEEFYKILGVAKDASDTDIKKVRGSRSDYAIFSPVSAAPISFSCVGIGYTACSRHCYPERMQFYHFRLRPFSGQAR